MGNFFEDLFGGSGNEYFDKAQSMLNDSFNAQKDLISGSSDAGLREANANTDIAASRGGYKGTPLEQVIKASLRQSSEQTKQAGLTKTQAQQSQAQSGLEMNKLADLRARQANNTALIGSIFSGLGSIHGWLNPAKV